MAQSSHRVHFKISLELAMAITINFGFQVYTKNELSFEGNLSMMVSRRLVEMLLIIDGLCYQIAEKNVSN